MTDHRVLLKKYMAWVYHEEGICYVPTWLEEPAHAGLTEDELAELVSIKKEVEAG